MLGLVGLLGLLALAFSTGFMPLVDTHNTLTGDQKKLFRTVALTRGGLIILYWFGILGLYGVLEIFGGVGGSIRKVWVY